MESIHHRGHCKTVLPSTPAEVNGDWVLSFRLQGLDPRERTWVDCHEHTLRELIQHSWGSPGKSLCLPEARDHCHRDPLTPWAYRPASVNATSGISSGCEPHNPRGRYSYFPGGAVVKNPPANVAGTREAGSVPGWRSPTAGYGNPLQYSCLEIPRTEESDRVQSMGSQRVRHDWTTKCVHTHRYICPATTKAGTSAKGRNRDNSNVRSQRGQPKPTGHHQSQGKCLSQGTKYHPLRSRPQR